MGLALAMVGLTSALFQGFGMRLLVPRIGERGAVIMGVGGLVTAAVLYTLAHQAWQVYVAISIGALQGGVQPSISALNSRAIDARSQGELQGAVQSIGSIAAIVGPPLYAEALAQCSGPGAVFALPGMPMLLSAAIAIVALVLFLNGLSAKTRADLRAGTGSLPGPAAQRD